ncbi:diguanylate cyclase [Xanthomonas campestris]|uniref:sensor domain-containing diguanylate cyclase n=1 Tax=Xanthomonas campestris TaxID=339 RepID=UPI002B22B7B4|nr:diguanylate cyclase [Xanthomonas campestris]MEA9771837.1 diguanylate cyclase [Xanthomonas campestris pv. raphani]MEA9800057.1 diguanylate cyclase [Xanthomonas campestris pv. raphani]MEA9834114.1 diguanylate cyclase [Xanthomonas campestris pv. raphani]MEA9923216.1 diguanylate cyclase [Xanthomonas campestris pv. raphani]MEA9949111.1 diguanylate cyclase [Xanthomonas campestris pv. raphani]
MLGGLIFVLIGVGGYITSRQSLTAAAWVSHTQEVIASIDEIQAGLLSAESSARGFVLTDNEAFLGVHADAIGRLPGRIARLEVLVQDNPLQLRNVAALDKLVDMRLVQINDLLHSYRATGLDGARASIAKGVFQTSSALRRQVQLMGELERRQLVSRTQANHDSARWVLWMTAIGILSGLLVMVLAYRLLSRELARRVRAEEEASTSSTRLAESFSTLERTSAGLEALARYSGLLQNCRNAEEALEITARTIAPLVPGVSGAVYLLRASRDRAEQVAAWGTLADGERGSIAPEECWALRRDRTHLVEDASVGMVCQHAGVNLPPHASTVCIPLSAQGTQLGMLALRGDNAQELASLTVAEAAAEQLSLALHNLRLRETLRQQSIRDPLTGLFNRRYLEEALNHELSRCTRRVQPLSVLMLDVDHFKQFNDLHGHSGGDRVLAAIGELLLTQTRGEDICCRYGGEELTIILPEVDLATASAMAEKLRAGIDGLQVMADGVSLPKITASFGVATFPGHAGNAAQLLRKADEALYRAKQAGRNQVVSAVTPGSV